MSALTESLTACVARAACIKSLASKGGVYAGPLSVRGPTECTRARGVYAGMYAGPETSLKREI